MSSAVGTALLLAASMAAADVAPPVSTPGPAVVPLRIELLASPNFGMEVGVRDVASVRQILFLYDELLSTRLAFDESTLLRRVVGVFARAAKVLLIDSSVIQFLDVVEHEVFGHGARARERGLAPTFAFGLPTPYHYLLDPKLKFSGTASYPESGLLDRDLPMTSGGIEADIFSGHFVALRAFRSGGRIHYSESLKYLDGSLSYVTRWVDSRVLGDQQDGSDVDSYVLKIQQRFNRRGRASQIEIGQRLRLAWATTFLNPLWWLSAYDAVVQHVGRGERYSVIPQLKLGRVRLFPVTRFALSPFGAEHTLDVMISGERFTLDASVRAVSTGLAGAWGVGARLFRWELRPEVEVGASLDVWVQPELLPNYRNAFDGRTLAGISGMVEATWRPLPYVGLVAQLGAKSSGYVMSQPLGEGLFGFAGVELSTGR